MAKDIETTTGATSERSPWLRLQFQNQPMIRKMLYALTPVALAGIYFFGWRVAALLAVAFFFAVLTEWIMRTRRGKPVSLAVFVTATLFTLSLPPTMPFWMAAVGVMVAILIGKEVFGGYGGNWANPAIVGRAFVYVAFPNAMTSSFVPTFRGFPGGFAHWSFTAMDKAPEWLAKAGLGVADVVTMATPSVAARDFGWTADWRMLFYGNIGGAFPAEGVSRVLGAGSIGEVCAPIIILASTYLLVTKTANWRLTLGMLFGALAVNGLLVLAGADRTLTMAQMLFGGSLLYGAAFIVTDPISAPRTNGGRYIFAIFAGTALVLIRWKGQFAGSLSFSILLANMIGPTADMAVRAFRNRHKPPVKAKEDAS